MTLLWSDPLPASQEKSTLLRLQPQLTRESQLGKAHFRSYHNNFVNELRKAKQRDESTDRVLLGLTENLKTSLKLENCDSVPKSSTSPGGRTANVNPSTPYFEFSIASSGHTYCVSRWPRPSKPGALPSSRSPLTTSTSRNRHVVIAVILAQD
jgi:hypothetical protein